jgi:hypothetical protein
MIGNKTALARLPLRDKGKVETLTDGIIPQGKLSGVSAF